MKTLMLILIFLAAAIALYDSGLLLLMRRECSRRARCERTGILTGAAPVFLEGGTGRAVLCVHGYIGSPTDFETLPAKLHAAGYAVSVPLLPGHGTDPRDFSRVSAADLEAFVCAEYDRLCERYTDVTVIGFSMGAALVTLLAAKRPLKRVVLLAPFYAITDAWKYVLPVEWYVKIAAPLVPFIYRPQMFKQLNDRSRMHEIVDYDYISLKGTLAAMRLSAQARKAAENLPAATLILHSRGDKATDFKAAERVALQQGLRFCAFEKSNHMLLWDYDREAAARAVVDFLAAAD